MAALFLISLSSFSFSAFMRASSCSFTASSYFTFKIYNAKSQCLDECLFRVNTYVLTPNFSSTSFSCFFSSVCWASNISNSSCKCITANQLCNCHRFNHYLFFSHFCIIFMYPVLNFSLSFECFLQKAAI